MLKKTYPQAASGSLLLTLAVNYDASKKDLMACVVDVIVKGLDAAKNAALTSLVSVFKFSSNGLMSESKAFKAMNQIAALKDRGMDLAELGLIENTSKAV